MTQGLQNAFAGKKVLIFGLGLNQGGVGSAKFFATHGAIVKVTDLKTKEALQPSIDALKDFPNIEYILGKHRNEDIDWADLIIKNPGVKPENPYMEYAKANNKQVELDMGIFLQYVSPSQIIGITGTKGKSTTSSLVAEILKVAGKKVIFAGNIGKSVLDTIEILQPNMLIVLELSSFQLEAFETHHMAPKWALITNIYPDHLNYYKTMEDYIQAKKLIAKYQTKDDFLFLRKDDPITTRTDFLQGTNSKIAYFSKEALPRDFNPKLIGDHNLENIAAALEIGKVFNIDQSLLLSTLANFTGVEFRLQLIRDINGVKIYNDTTATTPDATIQALKALSAQRASKDKSPNGGIILIVGGMNKNMPYEELSKAIEQYSKTVLFLAGDATDEIKYRMSTDKIKGTYDNLELLVQDIKQLIQPGDLVLFSPGATSFNMFQNEFDRGRKFNTAVEKIFS